MTGQSKVFSNSAMTCGGSDDEDERMKRSRVPATISALRPARARIAWCMVGTAVYQDGFTSSNQRNAFSPSKTGEQCTDAPARIDHVTAAIRPWMRTTGLMFRKRRFEKGRVGDALCNKSRFRGTRKNEK